MKTLFLLSAAIILMTADVRAQAIRTIDIGELKSMIAAKSEYIHVINFWATWCGPCVKELPLLEAIDERPDVKVTLVSLDLDIDPDQQKISKFVEHRGLRSEVVILEPADANVWIDEIEKDWSGAIPATLILNGKTGERRFIGRALKEGELEKYLDEITKS